MPSGRAAEFDLICPKVREDDVRLWHLLCLRHRVIHCQAGLGSFPTGGCLASWIQLSSSQLTLPALESQRQSWGPKPSLVRSSYGYRRDSYDNQLLRE